MEYLSVRQTAEKWGISKRRIQILCAQNRIAGAVKIDSSWVIQYHFHPREKAINNQKNPNVADYEDEAKTVLFKKKRAIELARLLEAKVIFNKHASNDPFGCSIRLRDTIPDIYSCIKVIVSEDEMGVNT